MTANWPGCASKSPTEKKITDPLGYLIQSRASLRAARPSARPPARPRSASRALFSQSRSPAEDPDAPLARYHRAAGWRE